MKPLGFDISEKAVRRAGLDYWKHVDLVQHDSYGQFRSSLPNEARLFFFTKFAQKTLYQAQFHEGDYLVFGRETTGLPQEVHKGEDPERLIRIPMPGSEIVRSLNLAGSVHVALYEALRQTEFKS